jgi:hypothetical protein
VLAQWRWVKTTEFGILFINIKHQKTRDRRIPCARIDIGPKRVRCTGTVSLYGLEYHPRHEDQVSTGTPKRVKALETPRKMRLGDDMEVTGGPVR